MERQTESPDWSSAIKTISGNHRGVTERGHDTDGAL